MAYFNFFTDVSNSGRKKGKLNYKAIIILFVVLAIIAGGVYGYLLLKENSYKKQLEFVENIRTNEVFLKQQNVAKEVSNKIGDAEKNYMFMYLFDQYVPSASTVNKTLIDELKALLPAEAEIEELAVSLNDIIMIINAKNSNDVMQMEKALRETGHYSNILVESIDKSPSAYNDEGDEDYEDNDEEIIFKIDLILNGGAILNEGN